LTIYQDFLKESLMRSPCPRRLDLGLHDSKGTPAGNIFKEIYFIL